MQDAASPSSAVTVFLNVTRFGLVAGEIEINVSANWDEVLGGLTADIWAIDVEEKRHALPQSLVPSLLEEIKSHDPDAFREIEKASGKFDKAA